MKLVIIAGGKGTRLGLKDIPKPMVELNGKPLLEHQILLAKKYGITDIYILSGHLSNVIIDYCGDGSIWDIRITHVVEEKPLSTAGALKQLESILTDKFMVFYGDTIMDGIGEFKGHEYKVWYKNENLIAYRDGSVDVSVPDMICVMDKDGTPVTNPHYENGMELTVFVLPAPEIWKTKRGLEVFGPRSFGFNFDYVPFNER